MISEATVSEFPWTVIECPLASFHGQCRQKMGFLPKELGVAGYNGPQKICRDRWKHTAVIYIIEPVLLGFYLATSLNDRVHYQVLKSEVEIIEAIENYCHPKKKKKARNHTNWGGKEPPR